MLGTYEYSDLPMTTEEFGVQSGQHIPGHVMHQYLTTYAKKFHVYRNIRFNAKVATVEKVSENGWRITYKTGEKGDQLITEKLIVATGMTSQAFLPTFVGTENFGAPLFHSRDFLQHADTLETSTDVVVFGGTKSAWDAVYAYATKGVKVNWVIRGSAIFRKLSSTTDNHIRIWSWSLLDGTTVCHSTEEVVGEACSYSIYHLLFAMYMGFSGWVQQNPQLLPRYFIWPYACEPFLGHPRKRCRKSQQIR